jgi:hypothetical protein
MATMKEAPGLVAGLAERLTVWADGLPGESQAVAVLITHHHWLCREELVATCLFEIEPDGAAVDWLAVPGFLAGADHPPLDIEVLRLAQHLGAQRLHRRIDVFEASSEFQPALMSLMVEAVGIEAARRTFGLDH